MFEKLSDRVFSIFSLEFENILISPTEYSLLFLDLHSGLNESVLEHVTNQVWIHSGIEYSETLSLVELLCGKRSKVKS